APSDRMPGGEAADHAGRLSADAERAAPRVQPVDEPGPGRRLRREHDPERDRAAGAAQVGDAGELVEPALDEVPADTGPCARAERAGGLGAGRADAARRPDTRRAEDAHGAPPLLRRDERPDRHAEPPYRPRP